MAAPDVVRWADVEPVEIVPGLRRRTLGTGERGMLVEIRADPGVIIPEHSHPAEQIGYVISGEVELTIAGTLYYFAPGDSWAIPGDMLHAAHFPVPSVLVECFAPVRDEYRRRSSA